jgi:hypothetical protein
MSKKLFSPTSIYHSHTIQRVNKFDVSCILLQSITVKESVIHVSQNFWELGVLWLKHNLFIISRKQVIKL